MSLLWKSQQLGYEDVPQELRHIVRENKEFWMVAWLQFIVLISTHFVGAAIAVFVAQWVFTSVNHITVGVVAAVAYGVGVIALTLQNISRQIRRMEIHALTLHDEILYSQDKLEEVERGVGKSRSHIF